MLRSPSAALVARRHARSHLTHSRRTEIDLMRALRLVIALVSLGVACASLSSLRSKSECEEAGGLWIDGWCRAKTVDGDKPCTKGSDCEAGYCLVDWKDEVLMGSPVP